METPKEQPDAGESQPKDIKETSQPKAPAKDAREPKPPKDSKQTVEAKQPKEEHKPAKEAKKKIKKIVTKGIVYIKASFNNTIITITDLNGDTLVWASAGTIGFKDSRKSTPYAAQKAAENAANKAIQLGLKEVDVKVKGPGAGRETAIRSLQATGLEVKTIEDITPLPHNGCRPRKKRRV